MLCALWSCYIDTTGSLRARHVHACFLRVLGRSKRIFKDTVHLIARFECHLNAKLIISTSNRKARIPRSTIPTHFCLRVIHIFKTVRRVFTAPLHFPTYFWQTKREGCPGFKLFTNSQFAQYIKYSAFKMQSQKKVCGIYLSLKGTALLCRMVATLYFCL